MREEDAVREALEERAQALGIGEWGFVPTERIPFADEVRALCERDVCRRYGRSWACPPAVGTVDECRAECLRYRTMLVFSAVYRLEDSFDFEGMERGMRAFKEVCDRAAGTLEEAAPGFRLLSNEGCLRCARCTTGADTVTYFGGALFGR